MTVRRSPWPSPGPCMTGVAGTGIRQGDRDQTGGVRALSRKDARSRSAVRAARRSSAPANYPGVETKVHPHSRGQKRSLRAPFVWAGAIRRSTCAWSRLRDRSFWSEVPITQEIWEAVMGSNPSRIKNPQLPVQDPLFPDVDEFCRILSTKGGRKVRLPTAAEWEYAARAGTSNPGFAQESTKRRTVAGRMATSRCCP